MGSIDNRIPSVSKNYTDADNRTSMEQLRPRAVGGRSVASGRTTAGDVDLWKVLERTERTDNNRAPNIS